MQPSKRAKASRHCCEAINKFRNTSKRHWNQGQFGNLISISGNCVWVRRRRTNCSYARRTAGGSRFSPTKFTHWVNFGLEKHCEKSSNAIARKYWINKGHVIFILQGYCFDSDIAIPICRSTQILTKLRRYTIKYKTNIYFNIFLVTFCTLVWLLSLK